MKSYESSTTTLRAILAHPSLQRYKIDETMDAMTSASADARDVGEAIGMGGDVAFETDGLELGEELEALVKELEREREGDAEKDIRGRLEDTEMKAPKQPPEQVEVRESSKEVPKQHQVVQHA
jgi:charged multivesicular body protein 7